MLYALLACHDEALLATWTPEEEESVLDDLFAVHDKWGAKFRPVARLMPASTATTCRGAGALVLDGPFAETKEQLLGLYLIETDGFEEALTIARDLNRANPTAIYEIRPLITYVTDAARGPAETIDGTV